MPTRVHGVVACPDSAWSCCCSAARCRPGRSRPRRLDGEDLRLSLGAYAEYYRDAGGKARLGDILALPAQAFAALRGDHANLGKNAAAWWFQGAPGQPATAPTWPVSWRSTTWPLDDLKGLPADRRWAHRTAGERRPVRLLPSARCKCATSGSRCDCRPARAPSLLRWCRAPAPSTCRCTSAPTRPARPARKP
ncbi:7TMR-DISMED2 domain-containing protein [Pseudomonas aeruginosa]